jgi:multidrug resistance efflux pump
MAMASQKYTTAVDVERHEREASAKSSAQKSKPSPGTLNISNQNQKSSGGAVELQQFLRDNFEPSAKKQDKAEQPVKKLGSGVVGKAKVPGSGNSDKESKHPQQAEMDRPGPLFTTAASIAKSRRTKQIIKTLIGILLIVAAGWAPTLRLFQVSSVEAVINARVVTMRTPIEGIVQFQRDMNDLNAVLEDGMLIASVSNQRVDKGQANDLTKQIELELIELDRIKAEQISLLRRRARLVEQVEQYKTVRLSELETLLDEAAANQTEIEVALAGSDARRERTAELYEQKLVAYEKFNENETDVAILGARLNQIKAQRRRVELEYETLASGGYFGDHFNDRIRPANEIDKTDDMLSEIDANLSAQAARVSSLRKSLNRENNNLELLENAEIVLPVTGRVWELLVANGEQVSRGQPLLRMLDCTHVLITTSVSEEVYNRLTVGDAAKFILRDSNREFSANVVQLSGVSSASANLAILPSALEKEPYRATVNVPELDAAGQCLLGKTGRVVFDVKS